MIPILVRLTCHVPTDGAFFQHEDTKETKSYIFFFVFLRVLRVFVSSCLRVFVLKKIFRQSFGCETGMDGRNANQNYFLPLNYAVKILLLLIQFDLP
jgi:hypothetical protein